MTLRHFFVFLAFGLALTPTKVAGKPIQILPSLINSGSDIQESLETGTGLASTTIKGRGTTLVINYRSDEPLDVFMVPLQNNDAYVPTDSLKFTLPALPDVTVNVDLTVSPGWSAATHKWIIHVLSETENASVSFTDISIVDNNILAIISAAVHHFFVPEPHTPSSFHAMRGYRILGRSFTVMFGMLMLVTCAACAVIVGSYRRRTALLSVVVGAVLLYQARLSVDLLRLTNEHLRGYASGHYDEAGSIYLVADALRSLKDPSTSAYVCRDGTSYKEKLLRYFAYPVRVSAEDAASASANIAIIMNTFKSGYESMPTDTDGIVRLRCGRLDRRATLLGSFPDGAILYQLLPSS